MTELDALIETLARSYYRNLKSVVQSSDMSVNALALKQALLWLDAESMGIDITPYLAEISAQFLEATPPKTDSNAAHYRMTRKAYELFSEGCDILRAIGLSAN
ncbi:hypothetical protein ACN4EG_25240 [Alkalinema pantanalense CENA528]|uniref:hypothetical protein n=1 Tax=Alkalinema pantanalense TaxID=1620705 RepID=UPI003D6F4181